jgi:hypothetical protein
VRTNGRNLPLFSSYMTAEDITKIHPFAHDASRSIYYINYWYGEHALASGPDHVLWLNRSPAKYTTIYENPHVSAWYFLDLAPHQLSVDTTAMLLSLTIPLRPVTSRLVRHGDDIPRIPGPPPPYQIPEHVRADEPARRHAVTSHIHAPQLRGRILTFWIWQQSAGLVFRFRVLIDEDSQRLIIARRRVGEAVGNLTMPL